jgi:4-amino-4-deoxy-L-arabinose transferase-like glycosyltransferase
MVSLYLGYLTYLVFLYATAHNRAASMVCLFHGDYGPADPAFKPDGASTANGPAWSVDAGLLKQAHNIGEAEAIERHLIHGETVSWCDQGYAWVEQDAITWFYIAALLFVVLPYLIVRIRRRAKDASWGLRRATRGQRRLTG